MPADICSSPEAVIDPVTGLFTFYTTDMFTYPPGIYTIGTVGTVGLESITEYW